MAITAKDVQVLRERSGCGMMDCKNALTEAGGDLEKAIIILREKGLAAQTKKAGRIAAEGIVYAKVDASAGVGALIEVNSETDFVAKNEKFVGFADACAQAVIASNPASVEELAAILPQGSERTIGEQLQDLILQIGENMKIRRFERALGSVATYIHGGGRIGVMVQYTAPEGANCEEAMKDICMQIAAANPQYLSKEAVPADEIEKEKEILTVQARNEGKPDNIIEKMVMGRIGKFYKEVCLMEQEYVKDPDITVKKYLENIGKEVGGAVTVTAYTRYERGEGIEKREDNFAEEVASMVK